MRFQRSPFYQTNRNFGQRIKYFFQNPSPLNRLITINVAVYLGVLLFKVFINLFGFLFVKEDSGQLMRIIALFLSVPADLPTLLVKPWTLITSIFSHMEFFHLLFNMIMLWFSGSIFLHYFKANSLYKVYIAGGIIGNLLFILSYNFFPVFESVTNYAIALGASGSVLAILIAAATKAPNQKINLIFIGNVSLKWIAIAFVLIDIVSLPRGNSGGHFAHLGGALFGFLYAYFPKLSLIKNPLFTFQKQKTNRTYASKHPKSDEQYNKERAEERQRVDKILDKISKSGYQNLTKEEKDFLFKTSNKRNW